MDSESHFGETSDNSATFYFGSHGHGVVTMEKPNSSHLGNFDSFCNNSHVFRVERDVMRQVIG